MSDDSPRYRLWKFFSDEHNLTLLESELDDIVHEVQRYQKTFKRIRWWCSTCAEWTDHETKKCPKNALAS